MNTPRLVIGGLLLVGAAALVPLGPTPRSAAQDGAAAVKSAAFVGSKKCMKCHIKEHRSWAKTEMGKALETLAPNAKADVKQKAGLDPKVDYRTDARCLKCHTVGHGQRGGFDPAVHLQTDAEQLAGIGCESCHGAAGDYLVDGLHDRAYKGKQAERQAAQIERGFVPKPDEQGCRSCHNEDSPTFQPFDYEKRKHDGLHEVPKK